MELDQDSSRATAEKDAKSKREQDQNDAAAKIEREEKQIAAKIEREEKDADAKREQDREDVEARLAREEKDADAKRARDDADAAAKRETAQERERMEIAQAAKQLELDRKAKYKQDGGDKMRKPGKHLLLTDQRAQIVELWGEKYGFNRSSGDEVVVCTAHADPQDNHCMSIYDSLGFDTELGEPAEDRRATLAPGCPKGLALMGVVGAVVLTRPTGLHNELLHYYSRQSVNGADGLLRTRLPCNVTGVEKLVCSMEWDHIEAKANGGEDVPENLHLISTVLNATIGDANTREWALANGYGPLKVEPPSAPVLAHSLLLPS